MSDSYLFWESLLTNTQANILIFARVAGIFAFNPIFSRRNIPSRIKAGATMALALFISGSVISSSDLSVVNYDSFLEYAVAIFLEIAVGLILGFLTNMFLSMLLYAGEIMDTSSGLGMAKIYDPATQTQQALFGTYMNYMFLIYFFITNSHLQMIRIYLLSYEIIPLGLEAINTNVLLVIVEYLGVLFTLALKLAMPVVMAEIIIEVCVGILMKTVPTIQVMTINIQLKVIAGLLLMFVLAVPMSDAIERYMADMMESIESVLPMIMP